MLVTCLLEFMFAVIGVQLFKVMAFFMYLNVVRLKTKQNVGRKLTFKVRRSRRRMP